MIHYILWALAITVGLLILWFASFGFIVLGMLSDLSNFLNSIWPGKKP